MTFRFYLGTHRPTWLWRVTDVPLFVSHRVLRDRRSAFPRATTPWALDSGGFTELNLHGRWVTSPREYVDEVHRYTEQIGGLEWASPQDWMCEPWVVAKTGLSVAEHQRRTVDNYLTLRDLAPDLPFIPVLQGWELGDYHAHVDAYTAAGVDLAGQPVVGIGSVCRRQHTGQIAAILDSLHARGIAMHGFGVKTEGLRSYGELLASADSLAWSYRARREARMGNTHPGCSHSTCANCMTYALAWRQQLLHGLRTPQLAFPLFGGAA